ncbi:MAG: hypothetical protein GY858_10365 [Candidatus Omnitrophica bacterium]|nr:hypothetical protein [Candidatus Omnitrophota bacterium]
MKKSFIYLCAVSLVLCMTIYVNPVSAQSADQRLVIKDTSANGGGVTFTVRSDGYVGIGTTNPQKEIDLGGGGITADGSDYTGYGLPEGYVVPGSFFKQSGMTGRLNFGYGGAGGGNLEAYSRWTDTGRNGEFRFTYGGGASMGFVQFIHYNGASWDIRMTLDSSGDLDVAGDVTANGTVLSDYVFEDDYKLMAIKDVEAYIEKEGHLPNVMSAVEFEKNPIGLGEMQTKLLEKIEELTLYTIEQEKAIEQLTNRLIILEETRRQ